MAPALTGEAPAMARRLRDVRAEQTLATFLAFGVCLAVLADPGVLAGMAVAALLWHATRTPEAGRWTVAVLSAGVAWTLRETIVVGWPWRLLVPHATHVLSPALTTLPPMFALRGVLTEALCGPLLLLLAAQANAIRQRLLLHHLRAEEHGERMSRRRAQRPVEPPAPISMAHPSGSIRLGVEASSRRPFDLKLSDLARHIFLPGLTGEGKTTTIMRLANGCLASGYGVIIVDCKGGLGDVVRALAQHHGVPLSIVSPTDPTSLGYDPCTGDPIDIANKLLGAFSYEGTAEVYKHAAMASMPPIARALLAAGEPVSLQTLQESYGKGAIAALGRRASERDPEGMHRQVLSDLEASGAALGAQSFAGLRFRLGALIQGRFGQLCLRRPALDWDDALAQPSVVYLELSALGESEDVELLGRVIAQDLKQVAARRLRDIRAGAAITPALVVWDEFASLREATQLTDLLLQGREARLPCVVSTQFVPMEENAVRQACLGAGVYIIHRLESDDAELLSKQFGTRKKFEMTLQTDLETGFSEKGSARRVDEFRVHPNLLRALPIGRVVVRVMPGNHHTTVQVYREE
jgi:hypothetical protein